MATSNVPANRGRATRRTAVSATYVAVGSDEYIAANGTFAVTLPSASDGVAGQMFRVGNIGTGTITVTPAGTDTISGAATLSLLTHTSVSLVSDGVSNWEQ